MIFPKVTYDFDEFLNWCGLTDESTLEELQEKINLEVIIDSIDRSYGVASSNGYIWISDSSVTSLLHELLHIIGWKLKMPKIWHKIIHRIL